MFDDFNIYQKEIIYDLGASFWIWMGCQSAKNIPYEIFGIAALLGASTSTHHTCTLSMIANLIGSDIGDRMSIYLSKRLKIYNTSYYLDNF